MGASMCQALRPETVDTNANAPHTNVITAIDTAMCSANRGPKREKEH